MVQTLFGKDIAFSVRTFRFTEGQSSTDTQNQTITCELYLEPADQVSAEQASDCICYSAEECSNECDLGTDNCSDNATCANTDPSFECTCNDGYM